MFIRSLHNITQRNYIPYFAVDCLVWQGPCIYTGHLLCWWNADLHHCLNTQDMRLCVALPLRVGYPLGGWGSSFLSQPVEWWEPSTGQPKMVCYFYHSVFNLRAAPWRPVAGSLPQAAEFNPRTALPRGDGKHLASCLTTRPGCPASVPLWPLKTFQSWPTPCWYCWLHHTNVRFNSRMHWWPIVSAQWELHLFCTNNTSKHCASYIHYWFMLISVHHG